MLSKKEKALIRLALYHQRKIDYYIKDKGSSYDIFSKGFTRGDLYYTYYICSYNRSLVSCYNDITEEEVFATYFDTPIYR